MNEQMRKQLNTYRRNLENKRIQGYIYSSILVFTIIVFDFVGIHSLIKITRRRMRTYSELSKLTTNLEIKSRNIDFLKTKLNESRFYLNMLNVAVPKEKKVEMYMVDLVNAAARNGLKQNRMQRRTTTDEYVELRATFQGPIFQVHPFIESIESIDRLSVIHKFSYILDDETAHVEASIRIYYLER